MTEQAPKFKVGQVVSLAKVAWYRKERKPQQFQKITFVFPWKGNKGWGICLDNGDECHEKWVKPLTDKESGRPR